MDCTEAYKEHIEYTFNAFCRVVIHYAAINTWRDRDKRRQREISFEYLTEEKFYPFCTSDTYFIDPYKGGYSGKVDNSLEIKSFFLISGGKAAVVFEFEEEIFHQMAFFVSMPVSLSWMFCSDTAWNDRNSTPFLQPTYKLIAVIAFIRQYKFSIQSKRLQQSLCHTDIISVPTGE